MEFIELKLIEKIGNVFSDAVTDRKYNPYQFIDKWCRSETCARIEDFDETLCSQAKSYILRCFEEEYQNDLPEKDENNSWYKDDMYWMGYLLTYWHFYDGTCGKDIGAQYNTDKILDEYDVLHTLGIKAAIRKIQEDDKNE